MRPRFVINKGISKKINALSSLFEVGTKYTAVIYNKKDKTTKIDCEDTCVAGPEGSGKNKCEFNFLGADTEDLKEGYATIEIYDEGSTLMAYKENFAVIRKNSLQIVETVSGTTHGTVHTNPGSAS